MYKAFYKSHKVSPYFDSTSISLMIRKTGKKGAKILQTQPSKEDKARNPDTNANPAVTNSYLAGHLSDVNQHSACIKFLEIFGAKNSSVNTVKLRLISFLYVTCEAA